MTTAIEADRSVVPSPRVLPPFVKQFSVVVPYCSGPERAHLHFRMGRYCALTALEALNPGSGLTDLERGPARFPLWPHGVTGSITHTDGFVSAAVASTSHVRALGIDTERILSPDHAAGVASVIAIPEEMTRAAVVVYSRFEALTLVFSIKESIFKCLYPVVGKFFEFCDVRLVEVDAETNMFRVELATSLSSEFRRGSIVIGRFELKATRVDTGVCLSAD